MNNLNTKYNVNYNTHCTDLDTDVQEKISSGAAIPNGPSYNYSFNFWTAQLFATQAVCRRAAFIDTVSLFKAYFYERTTCH
jgi:hypothetical protein